MKDSVLRMQFFLGRKEFLRRRSVAALSRRESNGPTAEFRREVSQGFGGFNSSDRAIAKSGVLDCHASLHVGGILLRSNSNSGSLRLLIGRASQGSLSQCKLGVPHRR